MLNINFYGENGQSSCQAVAAETAGRREDRLLFDHQVKLAKLFDNVEIDEQSLTNVAAATDGKYFRAHNSEEIFADPKKDTCFVHMKNERCYGGCDSGSIITNNICSQLLNIMILNVHRS